MGFIKYTALLGDYYRYLVIRIKNIEWAHQEDIQRLSLTTFSNVPLNASFYEKLGFQRLSRNELMATLVVILVKEDELGLKNRVAMQLKILI